jgi:hypothetical protein
MKHMAGNMKSRWTNIFKEDGEKPWRNRDSEFESIVKNQRRMPQPLGIRMENIVRYTWIIAGI